MTPKHYLKVDLYNPGSLVKNHDELILAVMQHSLDILAINESRLLPNEEGKAPSLSEFTLHGVAFYARRAYELNSRHLRGVLIFYFNMKTSAAEAHRMLSNTYGEKQGHWVPYELKPRNVEQRLFACEQLVARQRRKGFLHRIVTGDEKWVHYDNPNAENHGISRPASTSTTKPNIHGSKVMLSIWWDQLGVVYYELLKSTERITGDRYRTQLMRLSRALKDKRSQYNERHDKVILQHDNARPHLGKVVKTYLETLKCEVLPHPPYSPDIAPSDYHLFRSIAHGLADQHFRSYEKLKNWIDLWIASKDDQFFQRGVRTLPERW
ncbi:Mariner Mos1 transposase [Eumeta japonica]|uniref:Mariner Mos1 transposase n=1 Tax=Eumeta variegata TaxID=151549 RepID=A0A4C1TT50_EUMVA|nr:Mariner Mos1 transposase [Eumeta japonica]